MYSRIITSKIAKKSLAAEYDDVVNPLIQTCNLFEAQFSKNSQ